jgi:hypothetical protein
MEEFKQNLKWFGEEIMNLYSSKASFFSKKRIESGLAFLLAQIFMIIYFFYHYQKMDVGALFTFVGIEFGVAGWNIYQIQREKRDGITTEVTEEISEEVIENLQPEPVNEPVTPPIQTSDIITEIPEESQD